MSINLTHNNTGFWILLMQYQGWDLYYALFYSQERQVREVIFDISLLQTRCWCGTMAQSTWLRPQTIYKDLFTWPQNSNPIQINISLIQPMRKWDIAIFYENWEVIDLLLYWMICDNFSCFFHTSIIEMYHYLYTSVTNWIFLYSHTLCLKKKSEKYIKLLLNFQMFVYSLGRTLQVASEFGLKGNEVCTLNLNF